MVMLVMPSAVPVVLLELQQDDNHTSVVIEWDSLFEQTLLYWLEKPRASCVGSSIGLESLCHSRLVEEGDSKSGRQSLGALRGLSCDDRHVEASGTDQRYTSRLLFEEA